MCGASGHFYALSLCMHVRVFIRVVNRSRAIFCENTCTSCKKWRSLLRLWLSDAYREIWPAENYS